MHSTSQQTMVTKRDRRYDRLYPNDVVAAILVSNGTHWYMLPIKLIILTALYNKMSAIHFHPNYAFFKAGGRRKNHEVVSIFNCYTKLEITTVP